MGESKIIVVANQKGGAGKSTLCMLLANFLVKQDGLNFGGIIDTDFQKSIVKRRNEDLRKISGSEPNQNLGPLYQVVSYQLSDASNISEFVAQLKATSNTYIIDTPGSLTSPGLIAFLTLADIILCPFDYDHLTLTSTQQFLEFFNNVKNRIKKETGYDIPAEIVLVPCRKPKNSGTKDEVKYWEKVRDIFKKIYHVTSEIPQSVEIKLRCDTLDLTPQQEKIAGETLYEIFNIIYNPNNDNQDEWQDEE